MPSPLKVEHVQDAAGGVFLIEGEGARLAEMTYRRRGPDHVVVDHTLVDPSLRGRGVARLLLDALVAWARRDGQRVSATCSYVVLQFERDASLADVRA